MDTLSLSVRFQFALTINFLDFLDHFLLNCCHSRREMEIEKAMGESEDKRLKTKYNNAIFVIKRALSLYSSVLLFSSIFNLHLQIHFVFTNLHFNNFRWSKIKFATFYGCDLSLSIRRKFYLWLMNVEILFCWDLVGFCWSLVSVQFFYRYVLR